MDNYEKLFCDTFEDIRRMTLNYIQAVYILENEPFIWLQSPNRKYHCLPFKLASRIHRKQGWKYVIPTEPKLSRLQGLKRFITG